ncbi:MAG: lactate utilization protein [Syntrophomonadaceae bacterium]|nr:lactate utilization protein [Syntrophomonadaceae bacterium]
MYMREELINWTYERKCQKAVEALKKNGFKAVYCPTGREAYNHIVAAAQDANTVGFGGSVTISQLQLQQVIKETGKETLIHNLPYLSLEEKLTIRRRQLTCDLFLTSTNAITLSGQLVNIDATGNRVAAMFFGPKKVIIVAGRNKIVEDTEAAINRIKNYAAPPNARRLNKKTPCTITGFCSECDSADRICRITVIIDRMPPFSDINIMVVNEDLGL